jgi:membrane associated rhomboid family serine protease
MQPSFTPHRQAGEIPFHGVHPRKSGLIASLAHVLLNQTGASATIPSLGASGAISGVMGAYLVLHPRRSVTVLLFRVVTQVPGFVAVGLWFVFQVISGLGMLGGMDTGVAYAAHIGGFVAGAGLAKPFSIGRPSDRRKLTWRHATRILP